MRSGGAATQHLDATLCVPATMWSASLGRFFVATVAIASRGISVALPHSPVLGGAAALAGDRVADVLVLAHRLSSDDVRRIASL